MKRSLWVSLGVGLLLALLLAGCVRPRPESGGAAQVDKGPTATRPASVLVPPPTNTPRPTADQTPTPTEVAEPTAEAPEATPEPGSATAGTGEVTYQVQWGDTLARIATQYGTTISAIMARNPQIVDRNQVYAGTVLIIPTGRSAGGPAPVAPETGDYVIQPGDTLATIAQRFGTTVAALTQANPWITSVDYIEAGRHLVIPAGGEVSAPRYHVVSYGETLSSIARQYGTTVWAIVVRNNLANANYIYSGQTLVIP
jgi:LysM repeat protein